MYHSPTSNRFFLWASFAALGAAAGFVRMALRRRKAIAVLARRELRSDAAFAALFPPPAGDIAVRLRAMLSRRLRIDLAGLLPSDRPSVELHLDYAGHEAMQHFVTDVEGAFDISLPDCDRCAAMPFGDLVARVAATVAKRASPPRASRR